MPLNQPGQGGAQAFVLFFNAGVIESVLALNDPIALSERPRTIASRSPRLCGSFLQGPLCTDWDVALWPWCLAQSKDQFFNRWLDRAGKGR